MSRLQRNIIIVIVSGLCIILLLWIPSNQQNNETIEKESLANHIQITPIRDQFNSDLDLNDNRNIKQKQTLQNNNNQQANNVLDNKGFVDDAGVVNNVIDNLENIQNNEIDKGDTIRKQFLGPTNDKQHAVIASAKHAWNAYKEFAWGHDNLKPLTHAPHDWFGLGLTIIDSLDTLYIMNMQEGMNRNFSFSSKCSLKFSYGFYLNFRI